MKKKFSKKALSSESTLQKWYDVMSLEVAIALFEMNLEGTNYVEARFHVLLLLNDDLLPLFSTFASC